MCGWQVKLCDTLAIHGSYMNALEIWSLFIKRYVNSSVYFTSQNSKTLVNPSNIAHTRRTGSLAVSRGALYFDYRTHVSR